MGMRTSAPLHGTAADTATAGRVDCVTGPASQTAHGDEDCRIPPRIELRDVETKTASRQQGAAGRTIQQHKHGVCSAGKATDHGQVGEGLGPAVGS